MRNRGRLSTERWFKGQNSVCREHQARAAAWNSLSSTLRRCTSFPARRYIKRIKLCATVIRITQNKPSTGGAVKVRISIAQLLTCGQIYPPAYQPTELHGPAARIARIERVKLRAGLNETKKNGSATGVARGSGIQLQCSIVVLNRANTLFRTDCNTVFIGNIKLCASGSSAIFRNTCSTLIKLTAKEIEISPFG